MNFIFDTNTKTILLPITGVEIELSIIKDMALKKLLLLKHEFHITIIGRETGTLLSDAEYDLAKTLVTKIDWDFTFQNEFYFIRKEYSKEETRESIIQLVILTGLSDFYAQLNDVTGKHFTVPFPHITLYTHSTVKTNELRGIGIYSQEAFEKLSPEHLL